MSMQNFYIDLTPLNDRDLELHITNIYAKRKALERRGISSASGGSSYHLSEILTLLNIAVAEKNSRSAAKQTRASIDLSRETKGLAEASLEQAKQSTTLSRETMELAKASHDLSQKMERLAKVAVGVALVSLVVAAVGIWQ